MAPWSNEAWVTSALNDEQVSNALVLMLSLRDTATTKKIVVVTSMNVSIKNRDILGKMFDMVFFLEESILTGNPILDENLASAYTFALIPFKRCVYISPNSMFLENADTLFESTYNFQSRINRNDGSLNLSAFILTPNKDIWIHIRDNIITGLQDISEQYLNIWLKNQSAVLNMGIMQDGIIADLSFHQRKLLSDQGHTPIIHFLGNAKNNETLFGQIQMINNLGLGLHEKLIVKTWLDRHCKVLQFQQSTLPNQTSLEVLGTTWEKQIKEPIAIVGMSCRYPAANNLEQFWNLLYNGEEGICFPPKMRWSKENACNAHAEKNSQAGYLSVSLDKFDAAFFGVSPKDAVYMDPQARLLHEVMWEALEDAGIDPLSLYGTHTGIFTGSWTNEYKDFVQDSVEKDFFRTYLGNSIGAIAARLSFVLGLTGPSIATESGCSSAIVALDLAVKSLRAGETNLAITGGVNLLLQPIQSSMMEVVISPDGRCKTFDAKADGFGRAEGCGVLVLKRMSDALRDRDHIWAMIRGSAISQEGMSRSLGTPTEHSEALAMQLALKDANVLPEQVSFVETHGTGTVVGDPMEVSAIGKAYYSPKRKEPLIIGSVKTNVGHTESCSGITGIMKAVLALQHEVIPKHRNIDTLNPDILLDSVPAVIPLANLSWPKVPGQPRICGVSSFGLTGTDGHVIIEEASDFKPSKFNLGLERPTHLMTISGKTSEALDELLCEYENRFLELAKKRDESFANLAYSANVGRTSFNHRACLVAKDYQDALKNLQNKTFLRSGIIDGNKLKVCFLFTGQGSQYVGMAKSLYETSPIFRVNFDACDRLLKEMYNISIHHVLWGSEPNSKELIRTIYSQTSIFCIEFCLLKLWQSWGIKPDYVLGHSLGEFCAAVAAEILDFEDALRLVAERSRLIEGLPKGSMLVIKASQPEVEQWMKAAKIDLDFAAINTLEQTVLAGDTKTVEAFLTFLKNQGTKAIILEATHAFHSRHMDPILESYGKTAQSITYKPGNPNIKYISGMEGRIIDDFSDIDANYWLRHTREKVSFIDACAVLQKSNCVNFLEIGPQPVLSSFVMQNNEGALLNCLPSLRKGSDDWDTILTSLGKMYLLGFQINWKHFDEPYCRQKVSLPFHPFHRKHYWVERNTNETSMIHPLIGYQMNNATSLNIFQNDLSLNSTPYLKDHYIGNRVLLPGACLADMCLFAGYCVSHNLSEVCDIGHAIRLENFEIHAPLELTDRKKCRLQTVVDLPERPVNLTETQHGFRVKVYHKPQNSDSAKWLLHASSTFIPVASTKNSLSLWNGNRIPEIISSTKATSPENFYKALNDQGMRFGESFRMIRKWWYVRQKTLKRAGDEVVIEMELPTDWNKYTLHPLIIDAALQTSGLTRFNHEDSKLKVPARINEITLLSSLTPESLNGTSSLYLYAFNNEAEKCHIFVSTENWKPIAHISDMEILDTNVRAIESILEQQVSSIPDAWEESWKVLSSPFAQSLECTMVQADLPNSCFTPENMQVFQQTQKLIYLYILNAFLQLGWQPELNANFNLTKFCSTLRICINFHDLIRFFLKILQQEGILLDLSDSEPDVWTVLRLPPSQNYINLEISQLNANLKSCHASMVAAIYERISANLPKILTGGESALAILYPQDELNQKLSAESYYHNHPCRTDAKIMLENSLRTLLKQTHAQNQNKHGKVFRVLEVGSGTGNSSHSLLQWLKQIWADKFEFYYTDISQTFFIKAEKKLEEFTENIVFKVFNIEQSPLSQGIPLGYFDMVSASDVLHATRNLEESLVHLRQTLKPGGMICLFETVAQSRDITFVFGLLDGYWRFEDKQWRSAHCCVEMDIWSQVLEKSGYKQVGSVKTYFDQFAFILSWADENCEVESLKPEKTIVADEMRKWIVFGDANNLEVISKVAKMLNSSGFRVEVVWRKDNTLNHETACSYLSNDIATRNLDILATEEMKTIFDEEQIHGIVYTWGMDSKQTDQKRIAQPFLNLAKITAQMLKPPKLLVVTIGVQPVNEDSSFLNPNAATLWGMVKSLKNETDMTVRVLDLEAGLESAKLADQILYELTMMERRDERHRLQVAYSGGVRYEPRFCIAKLPCLGDVLKLPPSIERYQLKLPSSHMIQDLVFESLEQESVGRNEIEVKIKAYALNFRDIFAILKPSKTFEDINAVGLDVAGVVTKVGADSTWKLGDEVFGFNFKGGLLSSNLILNSNAVVRMPSTMTHEEAVTLPAVFLTAYHCLVNVAKIKNEDKVLIHTGSGGVGLAAIQVAKMVGAEIITTAGNPRKRAYLKSLGIEHVFHSRDTSYEQDIIKVTNGKGVNIVLNSITGPGIKEATLRSTAKYGRFVEMSKLSVWKPEEVHELRPDVSYTIVDLAGLDQLTRDTIMNSLAEYLETGSLKPLPYTRFDALCIRQALQHFQKAKHIGKVVISMPEVSVHQGQYTTKVPLFNNKSTYLITGGLGGIGFQVCQWMLEQGATDIVLTGRNSPSQEVADQIKKLNSSSLNNVIVRLGDIGNFEHCKRMIGEIITNMKPLRGIMHCAGVLKDNMYTNQNWDSFEATYNPKINGTWNLHQLTRNCPLEHFVVYSSMAALVGTPYQPNHCSANCFEDAFVHYRHTLGLPGTSINWGQWAQVGCAKDISLNGLIPISVQRMLNGMEMVLRSQKRQVCLSELDSFNNFTMLCSSFKDYLDKRLWKQHSETEKDSHGTIKSDQFWQEMDAAQTEQEKRVVLSSQMSAILRQLLRLDDKISETANLQELGVDSLMMIEFKNCIQSLFGNRLTVTSSMVKNCDTIKALANAIVGNLMEEEEQIEPIQEGPMCTADLLKLLKSDLELETDIRILPGTSAPVKASQFRNVLVTGATGRMAPYLIAKLSTTFVDKIWCLIQGDQDEVTKKLKNKLDLLNLTKNMNLEKVECLAGNVTDSNLGLSKCAYDKLCNSVDAIIHCAAKTHAIDHIKLCLENITEDMRRVNIGGTKNVLRFASIGKVKNVFYPSTLSLQGQGHTKHVGSSTEFEVTDAIIEEKLGAFQATKYICEHLMKQANARGIPCKVFRFPWIANARNTNRAEDVLSNLYVLRFIVFLKTGAMPDTNITANVLPVDICADISLRLFLNEEAHNDVFNLAHLHPQLEKEFVNQAEEFGRTLEILEESKFESKIKEEAKQFKTSFKKLLRNQNLQIADAIKFVLGYKAYQQKHFVSKDVDMFVENYAHELPPAMEIIRQDLRCLKDAGLLKIFGI